MKRKSRRPREWLYWGQIWNDNSKYVSVRSFKPDKIDGAKIIRVRVIEVLSEKKK